MYRSESLSESVMTYTGSVLALQPWWRDGWITKSCKEVLGVGGNVCHLDCSGDFMGLYRSECIKLYSLDICRSLDVN